ncbi:ABC transporter permease [Rhabdothermincola sediminis]|uniref:ABC transporter permease n=1 Tax=Rhabdothermincola sediminis TaxID=2751370 RepID=UPI001AA07802|nr:ABC transporter permease [Rhabdothermincola sediminis]
MSELLAYVIRGIPVGCVFALMATGIVLTYKTSGVFNLAFGAQAFVSAAVYYDLVINRGWPSLAALAVAVAVIGPGLGLLLDRLLYRHLRSAGTLPKLVVSLGLLVAIPQIVKLWFGSGSAFNPPGAIRSSYVLRFGDYSLDTNQLATIAITAAAAGGLTLLFRATNLGLRMRAVVESARMAELNGVNAERVSSVSWMLSSFFAGLAGVLLAPLFAQISEVHFFTLLVAALAAAAFGRLSSIPLTLLGGLLLGVLQAMLAGYLPSDSVLAQGLRPSLPFLALFLLLLFWPGLRQPREVTDPLGGVDPPPPAPPAAIRDRTLTLATRGVAVVFVVGSSVLALTAFDAFWLSVVTKGVILGAIFLSFVILTGITGQISLCQATFAAVGAFTVARLVAETGVSVLVALFAGAAVAALVGALIALPALRLGGIYLALATLAFALMFEYVVRPLDWVSGGFRPPRVPRPRIGAVDFSSDRAFFVLALAVLALAALLVFAWKRGATGRMLDAVRGSEIAASSVGINPFARKVLAFSLSAGIAGFGGGLLASFEGRVNYDANFTYFFGLVWVVLVVTLGSRSIQAAITAGVAFMVFPRLLELAGVSQSFSQGIAFILFGLGAVTYAKHPEGIVEARTRASLEWTMRKLARRGESAAGRPPHQEDAVPAVGVGAGR